MMSINTFNTNSPSGIVLIETDDSKNNIPVRDLMVEDCIEAMDNKSGETKVNDLISQAVGFFANHVSKIYGQHFIDGWIRKP